MFCINSINAHTVHLVFLRLCLFVAGAILMAFQRAVSQADQQTPALLVWFGEEGDVCVCVVNIKPTTNGLRADRGR